MNDLPSELLTIIYRLLPGFVTAWVLYGLTAFRKPPPFERIVQALIFTAIAHAATAGLREVAFVFGRFTSLGTWTEDLNLACSLVLAVLLGLALAYFANKNTVHDRLWKLGITNGSSYPSNWYKSFANEKRWVILNLKGDRRLYGWALDWPDHPDEGHFVVTEAEWLLDDGSRAPLFEVDRFLIPANDIEIVEMLNHEHEIQASEEERDKARESLIGAQTDLGDTRCPENHQNQRNHPHR